MNKNYMKSDLKDNLIKISIIYFIFIFSFFVSISFGMLALLLVSAVFIFFTNKTINSISIYTSILPLSSLVILNGDPEKSYFFLLTLIFIIRLIIFRKMNLKLLFLFSLFSIYVFITGLYKGGVSFTNIITLINYLPLIFLVSKYKLKDLKLIAFSLTFGFLLSSLIGFCKNSIPGLARVLRSSTVLIGGYDTSRFSGLAYDTNYYGVWCVFLISVLTLFTIKNFNKKELVSIYSLILLLLIFGFLTYSKTFFLSVIILFIMYILLVIRLNPIKLTLILIMVFLFNLILSNTINFSISDFLQSRFFDKGRDLTSLTTHRNILWKEYIDFSLSSTDRLLFGAGINNQILNKQVAHNFYIEALYLVGGSGVVLLSTYFIIFFKSLKKNNNHKIFLFQWAPLIIFLIVAFSLNFFIVTETSMFIYLSLLCCTVDFGEEVKLE